MNTAGGLGGCYKFAYRGQHGTKCVEAAEILKEAGTDVVDNLPIRRCMHICDHQTPVRQPDRCTWCGRDLQAQDRPASSLLAEAVYSQLGQTHTQLKYTGIGTLKICIQPHVYICK